MKRIAGMILLWIGLVTAGCKGTLLGSMSAASGYQKGIKYYETGEYSTAAEYFATAVDKGLPKELEVYAYSYMGHCHFERENFDEAYVWYQKALATGAEEAMCNTNLGIWARNCEKYEEAERYYLEAIKADAAYPQALSSLGALYSLIGRAEDALPLLKQAVAFAPEAVNYANLAYAYAETGAFTEARVQLEEAKKRGYSQESCAVILTYIEAREAEPAEGTEDSPESGKNPAPTAVPTPETAPTGTPIPTSTVMPTVTAGKLIAIDPGHQEKGNYEKEPVGPGASEVKTKVSAGTQGSITKVSEHQFNLELSLKLRDTLEALGYQVVMTRETAEVDISNAERAELANEAGADIFIRVHADGAENTAANGISVLYPSENNPYVAELSTESQTLARCLLDGMCEATGAKRRGIIKRDDLTGMNWAKMPVVVIEAGFMTNAEEEKNLLNEEYQALLVKGIVKGIQEYFEN